MTIFVGALWLAITISGSAELEYTNKLLSQLPPSAKGFVTNKKNPSDKEFIALLPQAYKDALAEGRKYGQEKLFDILGQFTLVVGIILFFVPFFIRRGVVISQVILLMPLVLFLAMENSTFGHINHYTLAGFFLGAAGLMAERTMKFLKLRNGRRP